MNFRPLLLAAACSWLACACGGGGGGGGGGAVGGLLPFAINMAASPAVASDVRNVLEAGDRFQFEPDVNRANALYDAVWTQLVAVNTWTAANPLNTYQFYIDNDPVTNWGRAYRFTGFNVFAGPVRPFTAGTYTRPSGVSYTAVTFETWDSSNAELLVMLDPGNFVHAIQNTNGLPIIDQFHR